MSKKLKELELKIKNLESRFGKMRYETKGVVQSALNDGTKVFIQEETLHGIYLAYCIDTVDVWKANRIRIFCPLIHNPSRPIKEFPWAYPISAMGGIDDSGLNWVPPAGSMVAIVFEKGDRGSPYYLGTIWYRDKGPTGRENWLYKNIDEYKNVYAKNSLSGNPGRTGYLVGKDDESQVLPPWNTESYNGFDINSEVDFSNNVDAQRKITYPHIYGFKTPEKHMLKMVDGDAKCNRRWKRMELMSSCGNWLMFKDDHLHYGGQWSHTSCGAVEGDVNSQCGTIVSLSRGTTIDTTGGNGTNYRTIQSPPKEKVECEGKNSNKKIIGGHPNTGGPASKYPKGQVGDNPYFKHANECRPYKGPQTPQNNKCDLPQSGVQIMSISGHTLVMDDSVEEPSGKMHWDRSTKPFDFGCNNTFTGRLYIKSTTGHVIEINDSETSGSKTPTRGENNYIKLLTASGNKVELNDHTITPCTAGSKRGIHLQSTSNHTFDMCDEANQQCSPRRKEGGEIKSLAKRGYVRLRSGYGLELLMKDDYSQEETQQQYIQLLSPRKTSEGSCGPHLFRMQESKNSDGSFVFTRSGGKYIISTCDDSVEIVGDPEKNPSDKVEVVSRLKVVSTRDYYVNVTKKSHVFIADDKILLLAGKDCPPKNNDPGCVPCLGPVLVYVNGCIRLSDRVFASSSPTAQPASIFSMSPLTQCPSKPLCQDDGNRLPEEQVADEATLRGSGAITDGVGSENQARGI